MMPLKVYAPASIGNFSVGFDLLGAAIQPIDDSLLGDVIEIKRHGIGSFEIEGPFNNQLPKDITQNIIYDCLILFNSELKKRDIGPENLAIKLIKNLPVGSGLGSSASSIVACLNALNKWYKNPLSQTALLELMGQLEGSISGSVHYDNIAPCYLGGLQLMSNDSDICNELPVPKSWYLIVANPGIPISTKAARELLPETIKPNKAIEFAGLLANFCRSLYSENPAAALNYIQDVIAEPYRQTLLPDFKLHQSEAIKLGAKTFGISGSGPTLFAIADSLSKAQRINNYLLDNYSESSLSFSHICKLDTQGSRLI